MDPTVQVAIIGGIFLIASVVIGRRLERKADKASATLKEVESKVDGRLSESLDLTRRALEELTNIKTMIKQTAAHGTGQAEIDAAAAAPNPTVPKGT